MTHQDIINMAVEVGATGCANPDKWGFFEISYTSLERFARLVAAHEREESVKEVEKLLDGVVDTVIKESAEHKLVKNLTSCFREGITDAIRARGEK
jgi:hypothetical protein